MNEKKSRFNVISIYITPARFCSVDVRKQRRSSSHCSRFVKPLLHKQLSCAGYHVTSTSRCTWTAVTSLARRLYLFLPKRLALNRTQLCNCLDEIYFFSRFANWPLGNTVVPVCFHCPSSSWELDRDTYS